MEALDLYAWNADVSGALLIPLHICEVAIRNAVAEAIENVYGDRWPWSVGFERSLPNPRQVYSPKKDLFNTRSKEQTTGKVIPELKFAFWQSIFTSRHHQRFWYPYLENLFPNMDTALSIKDRRKLIYSELEQIRRLRNRIAHHEPIFTRNLTDDYQKILSLVGYRCAVTAKWLDDYQRATEIISKKP
ncbi:hypothetical protein [Acinetobacter baumannii]|uniref:hypothetical protein n=1 Tax=Acinetobacter baumannii TaxID=470 RepID=UPI003AF5D205